MSEAIEIEERLAAAIIGLGEYERRGKQRVQILLPRLDERSRFEAQLLGDILVDAGAVLIERSHPQSRIMYPQSPQEHFAQLVRTISRKLVTMAKPPLVLVK